jgi:hypothetical protein
MDPLEVLGLGSAFMVLYAFMANEYGTLSVRSLTYDALNFFGAIGLFIYAFQTGTIPFMVTNSVWACIAGLDVFKHMRRRSKRYRPVRRFMRLFR